MQMPEKKKKQPKRPEVRNLKIETHTRGDGYDAKKVSSIRLCGNWLEKSGFPPEGRVAITTMNQLLIIRVEN
jgi:hypothetical protein